MTSEQVYEMAAKMNSAKSEDKNVETKESETKANVEETKVETTEPKTAEVPEETKEKADTDKPKEEVKDEAKPDNSAEKEVEKETKQEGKDKKVHTKQEQIDYAFKRAKAKQKKLEERIRVLEEENKKFKNLTLEDFKNNQNDFIKYQVDQQVNLAEQKRLQEEYNSSRQEEFDYLNAQREAKCFPDKEALQKYYAIREQYGPSFVKDLDKYDDEQVVLGYLDDCDVAPLMMTVMMTDENIKNNILSKRSPYMKLRALEDLENRVKFAQAEITKKKTETVPEKIEETKPVEVKPSIPVVGSVTKSDHGSNGKIVKDYNSILHQLNQNRYGR